MLIKTLNCSVVRMLWVYAVLRYGMHLFVSMRTLYVDVQRTSVCSRAAVAGVNFRMLWMKQTMGKFINVQFVGEFLYGMPCHARRVCVCVYNMQQLWRQVCEIGLSAALLSIHTCILGWACVCGQWVEGQTENTSCSLYSQRKSVCVCV